MASMMASTLVLSRPSEKLGTHSISVGIGDEDKASHRLLPNLYGERRSWKAEMDRGSLVWWPRPKLSPWPDFNAAPGYALLKFRDSVLRQVSSDTTVCVFDHARSVT